MCSDSPAAFESLGDNCEFGFVQRLNGLEDGGLLRWAIAFPDALIDNLENGFVNLYQFDSLSPSAPAMVADAGTGLRFHTLMKSKDGVFIDDEPTRRQLHEKEQGKLAYLLQKLKDQLAQGQRHFVYKHNSGVSDAQALRLAEVISSYGPGSILVVHRTDDPTQVSSVKRVQGNLYYGYLADFAQYTSADKFDMAAWLALLKNAQKIMPAPDKA